VFGDASPLTLAALAAWVATAALGGNLLLRGKAYRLLLSAVAARTSSEPRRPILQATLMTLHWLGAVSGLILWAGYALSDRRPLAQSALVLLGAVALLGFTVVDRFAAAAAGQEIHRMSLAGHASCRQRVPAP
jgi:hypothetical protein